MPTPSIRIAVSCAAIAIAGSLGARAASADTQTRAWHLSAFGMLWVNENLGDIPARTLSGDVETFDQHFVGLAVARTLVQGLPIGIPVLGNSRLELEGQFVRHFGLQEYQEAVAAVVWRTPDLDLPAGIDVNLGFGNGFSYTFEEPVLEGVRKNRDVQQLLYYLSFELELTHEALPGVHVVPRLHHRSGVFGVVGPSGDGSNYVGLGLRIDFP